MLALLLLLLLLFLLCVDSTLTLRAEPVEGVFTLQHTPANHISRCAQVHVSHVVIIIIIIIIVLIIIIIVKEELLMEYFTIKE